jgi:hypothetical protein
MRIFLMAAVAACVAGAAWADAPDAKGGPDDAAQSARIAAEITRTVDLALSQALADLQSARLDAATMAEVRSAMESARTEIRVELSGLDGRLSTLNEEQEAELEARIEAAMARVETAMERASEALEAAAEEETQKD